MYKFEYICNITQKDLALILGRNLITRYILLKAAIISW